MSHARQRQHGVKALHAAELLNDSKGKAFEIQNLMSAPWVRSTEKIIYGFNRQNAKILDHKSR